MGKLLEGYKHHLSIGIMIFVIITTLKCTFNAVIEQFDTKGNNRDLMWLQSLLSQSLLVHMNNIQFEWQSVVVHFFEDILAQ